MELNQEIRIDDDYINDHNEMLNMNEGDRAIREILHLLEDSNTKVISNQDWRKSFLHHAILCASLLCLILFIAIIVIHRKHSSSSRRNPTSTLTSSLQEQQLQCPDIHPKDTVIVITDTNNVDTEVVSNDNDAYCSSQV